MDAIRAPASYELVVDQIRRAIQIGRFTTGERLPPERELAKQLVVSRTTVREAIRVLQGEGLIETRRGRTGGAIVVAPKVSAAEHRRTVRSRLAELDAVFEFRLIVEPAAAERAAERRTRKDVALLREDLASMDALFDGDEAESEPSPPSRFFAIDSRFHRRIAKAARNPLLVNAVDEGRTAMFLPVGAIFQTLHPSANDLHAEILAAIEAADPRLASAAMSRHIAATRAALHELAGSSRRPVRRR